MYVCVRVCMCVCVCVAKYTSGGGGACVVLVQELTGTGFPFGLETWQKGKTFSSQGKLIFWQNLGEISLKTSGAKLQGIGGNPVQLHSIRTFSCLQNWCSLRTKEQLEGSMKTSAHAPGEVR